MGDLLSVCASKWLGSNYRECPGRKVSEVSQVTLFPVNQLRYRISQMGEMMHPNLLAETRLTFTQLAHREKVAIATVWRWAQNGIRGIHLESLRIGGRRFTTAEAFERFIAASNEGGPKLSDTIGAVSESRLKAIEQAEAELSDWD